MDSVQLSDYYYYDTTYIECRCVQEDGKCITGDTDDWDRAVCHDSLCFSYFPCLEVQVGCTCIHGQVGGCDHRHGQVGGCDHRHGQVGGM